MDAEGRIGWIAQETLHNVKKYWGHTLLTTGWVWVAFHVKRFTPIVMRLLILKTITIYQRKRTALTLHIGNQQSFQSQLHIQSNNDT
jgi:hypothetical protein